MTYKWYVQIKCKRIVFNLGRYNNKSDAVFARYIAECILFKDNRSNRNNSNIFIQIEKCKNKGIIEQKVKDKINKKIGEQYNDD